MKAEVKSYIFAFSIAIGIFAALFFKIPVAIAEKNRETETYISVVSSDSPPSIELFQAIEKHAEAYEIPRKYAYGIAYSETRYGGPFDWNYRPDLTSSAGAVGPMQVMYSTAKGLFPEKTFTLEHLRTDIDFNVECSMKLLRKLYDKYGDWKLVFGCYNTGRPVINNYAEKVYNYNKSVVMDI
jgi:soluble lytic murein transglycosylase-like protein